MEKTVCSQHVVPKSAIGTSPPQPGMPPSALLLSALVPQDGFGDRFWDIDFLVLPILHNSLVHFADLWVLGGTCLRDTGDFPEGFELATHPYTLRAVPVDGDCRMLLCTILFVYHLLDVVAIF